MGGTFRQSEGSGHAGAAGSREDMHSVRWFGFKEWFAGMQAINPMPSLRDSPVRQVQECGRLAQDQFVDVRSIKDIDRNPAFVRIAERNRAICGLGYQHVNSPPIVSDSSRLLRAIECISPAGWPIGQIMPKFRMEAPLANAPGDDISISAVITANSFLLMLE